MSRVAYSVFIKDRVGKRQLDKIIRISGLCPEQRQLGSHIQKLFEMGVVNISASCEYDCVMWRHPRKSIDMGVGVVTFKSTVIEPQDMVGPETIV